MKTKLHTSFDFCNTPHSLQLVGPSTNSCSSPSSQRSQHKVSHSFLSLLPSLPYALDSSLLRALGFSQLKMHTPSSAPKLVLYSYWQSSCSWRVRFALNLKGLPYEYRAVNLSKGEHLTPEFEKLNPLHYVPVLVDGDVIVSDSYAILLYLEEKYPQNPLLPADPQLRAINLQAASIVSSSIQPLHMMSLLKYVEDKFGVEERVAWAQLHIGKGFQALEKLLKDCAGAFSTGEKAYMADVFLAPQIAIAAERFNVDMSGTPTLSRIYESCKVLPEFQASLPEKQPDAVVG